MRNTFEIDPHPGNTRILFIGDPTSTHARSWVDLLGGSQINIRFFAVPSDPPPSDWPVRTYLTLSSPPPGLDPNIRKCLHPTPEQSSGGTSSIADTQRSREEWLAEIITQWGPDIIHTFGVDPASFFFLKVRREFELRNHMGTWVVQTRGGSDLTLARADANVAPQIADVLGECDQIITDNRKNFDYLGELNIPEEKIAPISPVPGTGGLDVERYARARKTPPSKRERVILWPKAYECPWSKALPVMEAIRDAWNQLKPCKIHMLAANTEVCAWFNLMPEEIRKSCLIYDRISRDRVIDLMSEARVVLAPSLVDGIPNSMYEAMALGAFPVVSPLETIETVVANESNVLFARNLYPEEIAAALVRAMNDDALVDQAATNNVEVLRKHADRSATATRVIDYYSGLTDSKKNAKTIESPLVSVITPVYEEDSPFLGETVQSVLAQDYGNIEYIVLYGGAKESTKELRKKCGDRIRWVATDDAREAEIVNKGFRLARGEIVCVMNCGDTLFSRAISNAVSFLQERPDVLVAYPDWYNISDDSRLLRRVEAPEYDFMSMFLHRRFFTGPVAFLRQSAVALTGGIDPGFEYDAGLDFWLRLGLYGCLTRMPKPLATSRIGQPSAPSDSRASRSAEEYVRLVKRFFNMPSLPAEIGRARMKSLSVAHLYASRASRKFSLTWLKHYGKYILFYPPYFLNDRENIRGILPTYFKIGGK